MTLLPKLALRKLANDYHTAPPAIQRAKELDAVNKINTAARLDGVKINPFAVAHMDYTTPEARQLNLPYAKTLAYMSGRNADKAAGPFLSSLRRQFTKEEAPYRRRYAITQSWDADIPQAVRDRYNRIINAVDKKDYDSLEREWNTY